MTSNHRLKVGVDFGTTFSGISWIHTSKPDEVNVVVKWPGTAQFFAKVPSEISYTPKGEVNKWGYQIKLSDEKIAWFKLLLQPTQYTSTSASSSMLSGANGLAAGKKPVEIVADYLACLRTHFLETIKVGLGKAFLEATPIDYTLTVPAIWNDAAKSLTLEAAEKAGFGNASTIQLMSEPDAAAAWTLLRDINPNNLKVNDAFVVVDCGGGTVDLVSYEIQKLEPFTVKECAKGTGGLCGSIFLNEGFKELVKSRIGAKFEKMKTVTKNRMFKEWEVVLKREFSNSEEDDIFSCPIGGGIPDSLEMGIEGGDFMIAREDMLGIFDPVINEIIPLVQEQIDIVESHSKGNLHISAILLVGGFGESKYLSQRLEQELKEGKGASSRKSSIEILQPRKAWSAVSRGAALGIRISSRKARRHYGVICRTDFIHGFHPLRNLVHDSHTGHAKCEDYILWYIKKYDQVSEDNPISLPFYRTVPINDNLQFVDHIADCENDKAPQYSNQTNGPSIEIRKVHSDLSVVPRHLFLKKIGLENTPYYQISYNLIMTVRSGDIHFELEFQGKKYGSAKTKYVHD